MLSKKPFEVPSYLLISSEGMPQVRMAVAGADHPLVLNSIRLGVDAGLIDPVLIGSPENIRAAAREINWDLGKHEIITVDGDQQTAVTAVGICKSKEAAALMKGHIHTDTLMKAVINRNTGLRTSRRLSHIFHMTIPNDKRVLMITDGAVNVFPDTSTKIDIVNNAVGLAHALGNPAPRVAILSGTELVTPSMPSSIDANEVVKRANAGEVTGAFVDGPFAFDNAVSPESAKLKNISSPVAGQSDILVVPNIETGNSLFKMMVYFMSGLAAGIVMGAEVPIVLTSRADPPEARLAATAIASIVANTARH